MPYHSLGGLKAPCKKTNKNNNKNPLQISHQSKQCDWSHSASKRKRNKDLNKSVCFARKNSTYLGYWLKARKPVTEGKTESCSAQPINQDVFTNRHGWGGYFTWKTVGLSSDSCPCRRLNLPSFSWMVANESPLAMGLGIPSST